MTAQYPEEFVNEHASIDVSALLLYFVTADLPVEPDPPEDAIHSTALWRGYIGVWRLNRDGTLDLVQLEFQRLNAANVVQRFEPQRATGDFELVFRPFFFRPQHENSVRRRSSRYRSIQMDD